ncbi:hypothetical protein H0H93_008841 [Arthromyces matolae]|nr:hypothetical protein H0H93_008841 [Arthromyces matolae]
MGETSLRTPRRAPTRKATIGPPLPAGQPIPRGPKSRVDDRIKKRMSMRYAEMVASPTDIPSVPGLPSPSGADGMMSFTGGVDMMDGARGPKLVNDKRLLEDERFNPDAFLKIKLANSTESELMSLQSSLHNVKEETNSELQHNVFKNYAEFVLISKEITSLETEMMELKDLLSEYKSMPSVLHIPDPTNQSSNPNLFSAYKRSSAADLRIMYFNQMQELHAHIEGAAKFAPTTPGRHVVSEMEGILSLNAATYKSMGRVRFVILDDLVLVARRRRRKGTGTDGSGASGGTVNEGKLVAERCWPLAEMLVLDTKDSARMTNVFKIRHGKETHVYRTENPQDKKSLLSQLRHVAEDLSAKKRREREGEHERRKSMWQGGQNGGGDRSSLANFPEWMADMAARGGELPGEEMESGAKEKTERDARWVAEWADNLTVAIALRQWDKAVALVEEGVCIRDACYIYPEIHTKGNSKLSTTPPLAQKLPTLTTHLTKSLLDNLALPSIRKSVVITLVSYLLRLKAGPAARSALLSMRTKVINTHVRKIKFDGQVETYVHDLAVVYFTGIKHTADWFLASFKENEVASAFIDWARLQLEKFAEIFRKQVFTFDVEPQVVSNALEITYSQSRRVRLPRSASQFAADVLNQLLQEYGLDFRHLFERLLVEESKLKKNVESVAQLSFTDEVDIKVEPAPVSRRKTPAQLDSEPPSSFRPPALNLDTLAPPVSAVSKRGGISPVGNSPLLSAASGYTAISNASHRLAPGVLDGSQSPSSAISGRPRTPGSAAPPRARTPVSAAPPRPRTPISATPSRSTAMRSPAVPPLSASVHGDLPLISPTPRRPKSPHTSTRTPYRNGTDDSTYSSDRDRPPRDARSSPAPPPRSTNRPSSIHNRAASVKHKHIEPPARPSSEMDTIRRLNAEGFPAQWQKYGDSTPEPPPPAPLDKHIQLLVDEFEIRHKDVVKTTAEYIAALGSWTQELIESGRCSELEEFRAWKETVFLPAVGPESYRAGYADLMDRDVADVFI